MYTQKHLAQQPAQVQDRPREWKPEVMDKIKVFSCMAIKALDIDAIRINESTQVTWCAGTMDY